MVTSTWNSPARPAFKADNSGSNTTNRLTEGWHAQPNGMLVELVGARESARAFAIQSSASDWTDGVRPRLEFLRPIAPLAGTLA